MTPTATQSSLLLVMGRVRGTEVHKLRLFLSQSDQLSIYRRLSANPYSSEWAKGQLDPKLTSRRDILTLDLELDVFMKTIPPSPKVRRAVWRSYDCIDIAYLHELNPNFPLSVGSFVMTTNRPDFNKPRKGSKRIYQKALGRSSRCLTIMGDGDQIVMVPIHDYAGAVSLKISIPIQHYERIAALSSRSRTI